MFWTTAMGNKQRLAEINKYRTELGHRHWKKLWSATDRKNWAGQITDQINEAAQDHHMGASSSTAAMPAAVERRSTAAFFLDFTILDNNVRLPRRVQTDAAGFDMFSPCDVILKPFEKSTIACRVSVSIPEGYVGLLHPDPWIAENGGVILLGGLLESGPEMEVSITLMTLLDRPYSIDANTALAQLVVHSCSPGRACLVPPAQAASQKSGWCLPKPTASDCLRGVFKAAVVRQKPSEADAADATAANATPALAPAAVAQKRDKDEWSSDAEPWNEM